jgi:hypothetical protein
MTSISSTSPFAIPTLAASLAALATQKRQTVSAAQSGADGGPLQSKQIQPFDITKTDSYAQWKADNAVAQDTQDLANTVAAAFQAMIAQRPDLADATFDFTGGKDGIKVTSDALKDDDRIWLEKQLNANSTLVNMVKRLNDDVGEVVDEAAAVKATKAGVPAPPKTPAARIDSAVPILALLQGVVNKAAPADSSSDTTYADRWDQPVDLRKAKTNSLAGMIDAKRQLDALQDGSIVTHMGDGRVITGAYVDLDPYAAAAGIAAAFLPRASSTASQAAMVQAVMRQVDRLV